MSTLLRPFTEADLDRFADYWRDPVATGQFEGTRYSSPVEDRKRFDEDGFLGKGDGGRLVVSNEDDAFLGFVSWNRRSNGGNANGYCWNFGIGLFPEHRGQGIGRTAQRLLVDHLFATTTVERVEASTDSENIAERRCLESLGFTDEGVIRAGNFAKGGWRDMVLYSVLRSEHAAAS